MASGRTHEIINLAAFPPIVYYLQPNEFWGFAAGYLFGTFLLSPDNDIYHSRPVKRWKFLKIIWKPYTKIFSHRGVSHYPIIGSITRLFYLSIVAFLFYIILYILTEKFFPDFNKFFSQITINQNMFLSPFFVSFLIGLFLSEIIHIIVDMVYSFFKRLLPRRIF